MIATLSMYDWPGQSRHWDAFWALVRDALRADGIAAPEALTRGGSLWDHWESSNLVLGQTCGMPYRTRLHGKVCLLGALDHGLDGAPAGFYNSVLVVRRDRAGGVESFRDATLAYNGMDSESGWAAAQNHAMDRGFVFTRKLHSGAHRESARAVADGRADIAAIDAETWRLVTRFLPDVAAALRVLDVTRPTPGLPLICAPTLDPDRVADAVDTALGRADRQTLEALDILGFVRIPAEAYLAVPTPKLPSQDAPAA